MVFFYKTRTYQLFFLSNLFFLSKINFADYIICVNRVFFVQKKDGFLVLFFSLQGFLHYFLQTSSLTALKNVPILNDFLCVKYANLLTVSKFLLFLNPNLKINGLKK
ncbi:MAG TPA: hypothetical protein DEA97_03000 [Bacteroidales bacterium]|nr:MAG: hypothetical protein A2281_07915 [Bacteroidetes bacterium RIFOXYA12_FULL_38_20]HBS85494.1 hypothetical protein [Bacteroidales bacterium]